MLAGSIAFDSINQVSHFFSRYPLSQQHCYIKWNNETRAYFSYTFYTYSFRGEGYNRLVSRTDSDVD